MRRQDRDHSSPQRLLVSMALALSALAAFTGCGSDAELQGVITQECTSDSDCPDGSRCVTTSKSQRLCLTRETLSPDAGEGFDGEVFDPTGLAVCGSSLDIRFCSGGDICCEGECTSSQSDERNCGACGRSCLAGEECIDGLCSCGSQSCSDSEACCVGDGGVPQCRPLLDDRENCGGCGVACNADARESCLNGQCGCIKETLTPSGQRRVLELCQEGQACCPPPPDDPSALLGCVDLNTTDNCGACGNKCGAGEQCVNGQCTCGVVAHPSPDAWGPVCDTTLDTGSDRPRQACCFNPNGRRECRPFADCDCNGAQCTGLQLCCFNSAFSFDTCVDPTQDGNNCGGCSAVAGSPTIDSAFVCHPGEVCQRNFDYSLSRSPEEQNASGLYIGECKLNCLMREVACPGGINPDTGLPYEQTDQSCVDPQASHEFCGATLRVSATSTTTGRCSEADPQTYGQLKNYQGVRCGASERCEPKRFCDNPDPPPGTDSAGAACAPRTHYYFDVVEDASQFLDGEAVPQGGVFSISQGSSQADRDAYLENPFLRAVCAPL